MVLWLGSQLPALGTFILRSAPKIPDDRSSREVFDCCGALVTCLDTFQPTRCQSRFLFWGGKFLWRVNQPLLSCLRNSRPAMIFGLMKTHWFPLIRPLINPAISFQEGLWGRGWLTSHEVGEVWVDNFFQCSKSGLVVFYKEDYTIPT